MDAKVAVNIATGVLAIGLMLMIIGVWLKDFATRRIHFAQARRLLREMYNDPADVELWLHTPQPALHNFRPELMIRIGLGKIVVDYLEMVVSGSYS